MATTWQGPVYGAYLQAVVIFLCECLFKGKEPIAGARICNPFKDPRNRFSAWRNRLLKLVQIRTQVSKSTKHHPMVLTLEKGLIYIYRREEYSELMTLFKSGTNKTLKTLRS